MKKEISIAGGSPPDPKPESVQGDSGGSTLSGKKRTRLFWQVLGALLVVLVSYNLWQTTMLNLSISRQQAEAEEAARPARLQLILLEDTNCLECVSLQPYLDYLSNNGGQIDKQTKVELNSAEGQALIDQYQIKFLPTLIVKGELAKKESLSKFWSANGQVMGDSFILRNLPPPYLDINSGLVSGLVSLTKIRDPLCQSCYDVDNHLKVLNSLGIKIIKTNDVTANSSAGQSLINKYNIQFLPTIILSSEAKDYPQLQQVWSQVGIIADDGSYVFTKGVAQMGSYKDLASGEIINPPTNSSPGN